MKIASTIKTAGALALLAVLFATGVAQAQEAVQKPPLDPQAKLRAQIENRVENRDKNRDVRNELLEKKQTAREMKPVIAQASSSMLFKRATGMRIEIAKKMEVKMFEARKNALVKELTKAILNLEDISRRIDSRIAKAESSGRTMTEPKALLVTAREKLVKAKADVAALKALNASTTVSTNSSASSTSETDLAKPRQIGDAAIKSVKEARDAFQKVVVSIAQNMGLGEKRGEDRKQATTTKNASTTPSQP
jgi:hypothetical protein